MITYVVVTWPEIQDYMHFDWFDKECYLINDSKGQDDFGSSAYFIPTSRLITSSNHFKTSPHNSA